MHAAISNSCEVTAVSHLDYLSYNLYNVTDTCIDSLMVRYRYLALYYKYTLMYMYVATYRFRNS